MQDDPFNDDFNYDLGSADVEHHAGPPGDDESLRGPLLVAGGLLAAGAALGALLAHSWSW